MGAVGGVTGISNATRGPSSYFNKNGGPMGSAHGNNNGLPTINNPKGGIIPNNMSGSGGLGSYSNFNKNSAIG